MDYTVHGILQVRILEWVAFPFYRGSSQPRDQTQVSCIAGRFFLPAEPQGKLSTDTLDKSRHDLYSLWFPKESAWNGHGLLNTSFGVFSQ